MYWYSLFILTPFGQQFIEKSCWKYSKLVLEIMLLYIQKPQQSGELGNLMLTVCYEPTDNQVKVNVVRASELNIKEHDNKRYDGRFCYILYKYL